VKKTVLIRLAVASVALAISLLAIAATAYAWDEPHNQPERSSFGTNHGPTAAGRLCSDCHTPQVVGTDEDCRVCHGDLFGAGASPISSKGPHGVYTAGSDRCAACHTVHVASGAKLLPAATITATCYTCHDGTGGHGVYGAIAARGLSAASAHRIDTTNTVPGGNATTGGSSTMSFKGPGSTLGCDDCHSPHDSATVAAFTSDRMRTDYDNITARPANYTMTNKLLRKNPGGSVATATVYGSDWCLACHSGRVAAGPLHNHPADSAATTATPFYFQNVARLTSDATTGVTVMGSMGRTNRGFLMPYPRTAQQGAHKPICQQCHSDSRNVGALVDPGATAKATVWSVTATDGLAATDVPRFQTFPHETINDNLLVESNDDLCLNCHPVGQLP
jgi:predicted CXXCH cytochrome family protein